MVDESFFEDGKMFDGSSIAGWKGINDSDMILMPDAATAVIDVFTEEPTLIIRCDVIEPSTMQGYERDPRSAREARRGVPEDAPGSPTRRSSARRTSSSSSTTSAGRRRCTAAFYAIESSEGYWQTGKEMPEGNMGHRPGHQGRLLPGASPSTR